MEAIFHPTILTPIFTPCMQINYLRTIQYRAPLIPRSFSTQVTAINFTLWILLQVLELNNFHLIPLGPSLSSNSSDYYGIQQPSINYENGKSPKTTQNFFQDPQYYSQNYLPNSHMQSVYPYSQPLNSYHVNNNVMNMQPASIIVSLRCPQRGDNKELKYKIFQVIRSTKDPKFVEYTTQVPNSGILH
jgi:hypothetical protein